MAAERMENEASAGICADRSRTRSAAPVSSFDENIARLARGRAPPHAPAMDPAQSDSGARFYSSSPLAEISFQGFIHEQARGSQRFKLRRQQQDPSCSYRPCEWLRFRLPNRAHLSRLRHQQPSVGDRASYWHAGRHTVRARRARLRRRRGECLVPLCRRRRAPCGRTGTKGMGSAYVALGVPGNVVQSRPARLSGAHRPVVVWPDDAERVARLPDGGHPHLHGLARGIPEPQVSPAACDRHGPRFPRSDSRSPFRRASLDLHCTHDPRPWRSRCIGDGLSTPSPANNFRRSGARDIADYPARSRRGVAIIAGILFNFAVVGVFGLSVAIASLILGILFVTLVVVRTRTQEEPEART